MKKILCLLALSVATVLAFSSCSSDESDSIWYSMGIDQMQSSTTHVLSEMQTIEDAYFTSLGVNTSPFNFEGSVKDNDAKVKKACAAAEAALASSTWEGYYVFTVTNINTDKKIYTKAYGTKPTE